MVELLGILATTCILISLTQGKVKYLHIINAVGSFLFVIYGLLLGAFSVWLLNGCCFCVDIYKVLKLHKQQNQ